MTNDTYSIFPYNNNWPILFIKIYNKQPTRYTKLKTLVLPARRSAAQAARGIPDESLSPIDHRVSSLFPRSPRESLPSHSHATGDAPTLTAPLILHPGFGFRFYYMNHTNACFGGRVLKLEVKCVAPKYIIEHNGSSGLRRRGRGY